MSLEEVNQYYTDLLIMQYKDKPKAIATIGTTIEAVLMDQLPLTLQDAFDIETAVGAQLDILGKYIGVNRRILTFTQLIDLGDDDYRTLLKIKRALNSLGSSLYDIQTFVHDLLSGILLVFDHADMTMSFFVNSNYMSLNLAQAIVRQGLLPKPMGVSYSSILYLPNLTDLFGFRTYTFEPDNIVGFNTYEDYQTDWTFIVYDNVLDIGV